MGAVSSLREPRTTIGVNLVAGFRPELLRQAAPADAPPELDAGAQHDAVLWLSSSTSRAVRFAALRALGSVAEETSVLSPQRTRIRALLGTGEPLAGLYVELDPERDHVRASVDAPVTVLEHGDLEWPVLRPGRACRSRARPRFGDVADGLRHLAPNDLHPNAQLAAEAAEAAADQRAFGQMHDLVLTHRDVLGPTDLVGLRSRQVEAERSRSTVRSPWSDWVPSESLQ
jgi:hypothetical protein